MEKRILLVDDNEAIHLDFRKAFNRNNTTSTKFSELESLVFNQPEKSDSIHSPFPTFNVDSVYQGLDAVQLVRDNLAKNQRYALAFIDMRMPPGIDGVTTIQKLWEIDADLQVVICTAFSDYSFDDIYTKLKGSDNFLILKKPFDIIEILQLTSTLTKKWELSQLARSKIEKQDSELQHFFSEADFLYKLSQQDQTEFSVNQIFQFYIDNICAIHHFDLGHIYEAKEGEADDSIFLTSTNIWFFRDDNLQTNFQPISNEINIRIDGSLPGRVLETGECFCVDEINQDAHFLHSEIWQKSGMHSALAVPIKVNDRIFAVAEFFSKQTLTKNQHLLQLITASANQLGLMLTRRHNEEQIKENFANLELVYKELKNSQAQVLQQDKLASIGQLAAGVAHEINNPIAFLASNTEILKNYCTTFKTVFNEANQIFCQLGSDKHNTDLKQSWENLNTEKNLSFILEDSTELIKESLEGLTRISEIVTDLKTFSHMNEAEIQEVNINQCLDSTLKMIWNELKYKCNVIKNYSELPLLRCYPNQLNQVFMNLLINAGQAIPEKGDITITTRLLENVIEISISDTGSGISPEHIEKLFDPFFTTKPVGEGTGLGLSISYNIIQKHNGEIKVSSNGLNQGTCFTLLLPLLGINEEI